jgi:fermentation-respiration switch protein FrsA (DUF1100 family)
VTLLLLLEDRLLYHPRRHGDPWLSPPPGLTIEEVWLPAANLGAVHAWWCLYPGADGAVLFCHGNAGNLSQRGKDIEAIQHGLQQSVLIFDYAGYGRSPGEPSEAGCYAAANAAYDWLVQRVSPQRLIILGQSLGGGVAIDLASRRPHRTLAVFKTFTSVPDIALAKFPLLPTWLARNRFNNLAKIRQCTGPVFIAHGDCDHLIPLEQGERLFEAAPCPKRFFRMQGCGHHGAISADFLRPLADFLQEVDGLAILMPLK